MMLKSILILQSEIVTCFGLLEKRETYSVLLGLADNELKIIEENISLKHD